MQTEPVTADLRYLLALRDDAAYEQLLLLYQDRLYNFALRYTGSHHDAEEVVQDTFVKAHRAIYHRLTPERVANLSLPAWLYRICLNTARNHLRRRRPAQSQLDGNEPEEYLTVLAAPGQEPERLAERADLRAALLAEFAKLPHRYRAAVVLRLVENLSYQEIAEILGQPTGTVKSNVHRGVLALRAGLLPWWRGEASEEKDDAL